MTDDEGPREAVCRALIRYLETEPEVGTFRALIDYLDLDYSTAYAEGWMDFNNLLVRLHRLRPAVPALDVALQEQPE